MKRFYKTAEAGPAPGGHAVRLDGKVMKTPMQHPFLLPALLAEAVAAEWAAQGDGIIHATMPLTQIANTMIDKAAGHDRAEMNRTLVQYGSSDLVCYFATHPKDLVSRQELRWTPLLGWLKDAHGIVLERVDGIQYRHQPEDSLKKLSALIAGLEPLPFTVAQAAAGATGSVVIALALAAGHLTAEDAFQAACVDELYQLDKWGEDTEARRRLDRICADLAAAGKFMTLYTGGDC